MSLEIKTVNGIYIVFISNIRCVKYHIFKTNVILMNYYLVF